MSSICVFDFDDTLLHLPTKILLEEKVNGRWINIEVTTVEYNKIFDSKFINDNYRFRNNNKFDGLYYFNKNKTIFSDAIIAINNNNFAPAWDIFISKLKCGEEFKILTARSNSPYYIRKVIKYIIYKYLNNNDKNTLKIILKNLYKYKSFNKLVNKYLDSCEFIGTNSKYFKDKYKHNYEYKNLKCVAIKKIITDYDFIAYYDDSAYNIECIDIMINSLNINKKIKLFIV